jgi:hypothetical protein
MEFRWSQSVFSKLDWNSSEKKRAAYSYKAASWRQMLVVQPSFTYIEIIKTCYDQCGSYRYNAKVVVVDGLTMGMLYDLVEEPANSSGNNWGAAKFDLEWRVNSYPETEEGRTSASTDPRGDTKGKLVINLYHHFALSDPDYYLDCTPKMKSEAYTPVNVDWNEGEVLWQVDGYF